MATIHLDHSNITDLSQELVDLATAVTQMNTTGMSPEAVLHLTVVRGLLSQAASHTELADLIQTQARAGTRP